MGAKIGLGLVAAALVTFGLTAFGSLVFLSPVKAHPTPDAPQARTLLIRCTTSASPIFEGGAVGAPVPLTVEIRGDDLSIRDIPLVAWQKELPSQVKKALESALEQTPDGQRPADGRLDQILDRLDRIERRLKQIEREKSPSDGR